jgi:hypothetical protein
MLSNKELAQIAFHNEAIQAILSGDFIPAICNKEKKRAKSRKNSKIQ